MRPELPCIRPTAGLMIDILTLSECLVLIYDSKLCFTSKFIFFFLNLNLFLNTHVSILC